MSDASPVNESAAFADETPVETASAHAPVRRKRSMLDDPVVRYMSFSAIGLVVLFLVTIIAAYFMGVLGNPLPKTRYQRDLIVAEEAVSKAPQSSGLWHTYITLLIQDGQYRKAQDTIDRAKTVVKDEASTQELSMAQAELYFGTKDYKKAVTTTDDARKKIKKEYDLAVKKTGSEESMGKEINQNYWEILILKAEAQVKLDKPRDAIKTLDEYLKVFPDAADVTIRRGDLKVQVGDKTGAAKDYRTALKYMPGDKNALAGLKKIGAE